MVIMLRNGCALGLDSLLLCALVILELVRRLFRDLHLHIVSPTIASLVVPRMTPATTNNPEEAWLAEAEAELTAFAAEAEKVERIPNSLLRCPPPPQGVDLITPDPR